MILSDESRFFSAGATTGSALACTLCFLFPQITLYLMILYIILAGVSLYKLKDELHKFI